VEVSNDLLDFSVNHLRVKTVKNIYVSLQYLGGKFYFSAI